jgi:hypothetical protein
MMTREQAAATWCPMVRLVKATERSTVEHGQPVFNRAEVPGAGPGVPNASRCIADQCAMWRWGEMKSELQRRVVERTVAFPDRPPELRKFDEDVTVSVPHRGYCGLAGAPVIAGGSA